MSRKGLVAVVLALAFLAGSVGYVVGRGRPPGEASVDVGFLRDMLTHHEQAAVIANTELRRGEVPAVQVFAREILSFQGYEMGLMEAELESWGYAREDRPPEAMAWMGMAPMPVGQMPGLATGAELDALRAAQGRTADALFVELMIDHHAGGVRMASVAMDRADDAQVQELATRMARNQRQEITELEAARARAGLPEPAPIR